VPYRFTPCWTAQRWIGNDGIHQSSSRKIPKSTQWLVLCCVAYRQ